jgi:hypothetical protein
MASDAQRARTTQILRGIAGDNTSNTKAGRRTRRALKPTKAERRASTNVSAGRAPSDSGGGSFGGDILGAALDVLDVPGRAVRGSLVGLGELVTGDLDFDDAAAQFSGREHTADLLKKIGVEGPAANVLGLVGDIGTDPLSWLMPAKAALPSRLIGKLSKPETIEQLGRLAASRAGIADEVDDVVRNLGDRGANVLREEGTKLAKEATATLGRRKSAAFVDKDVLDVLGVKGGLTLGGRGPEIIPQSVRATMSAPFNKARVAAGDVLDKSKMLDAVRGQSGPLRKLARSGDPDAAWDAMHLERTRRAQASLAVGEAKERATQFQEIVSKVGRRGKRQALEDDKKLDLLYALEGDPEAKLRAITSLGEDTVNAARGWYDDQLRWLHEAQDAAGLPRSQNLPRLDEYVNRSLTDEMRALKSGGQRGTLGEAVESMLQKRELGPGSKVFGVELPENASAAEVRQLVNQLSKENLGVSMFETDISKLADTYALNVGREVGRLRSITQLKTLGVVDNVSAAAKAAQGTPLQEHAVEYDDLARAIGGGADDVPLPLPQGVQRTKVAAEIADQAKVRFGSQLSASPEVRDAMLRIEELTRPNNFDSKVLNVYDKALNWTKAWQTASPGFHSRNLFGGIFNNALAGINPKSYVDWLKANRAYSKGDDAWASFRAANPERADMYVQSRRLAGGNQFQREIIVEGTSKNPITTQGPVIRFSRDKIGSNTEGFLRGSLAYDTLKHGGTAEDAAELVAKFHFDYDDLTRFEREYVKRVVPFYVWSRRNLPLQVDMLLKRPSVYTKYNAFRRNLSFGVPTDPIVPSYYPENQATATPFTEGGERIYWMPDLPLRDLSRLDNPRDALSMVTPLLKTPIEYRSEKQFFKDLPITKKQIEVPFAMSFLTPALKLLGKAKTNADGTTTMAEKDAYVIEQFLPMLGKARRLAPSETKYQDREITNFLNFTLGLGLRTNTKAEQQSELRRRQFAEFSKQQ